MRTMPFPAWLCLAVLLCALPARAQRLFEPPEDAFESLRRHSSAELDLDRAVERAEEEAPIEDDDDSDNPYEIRRREPPPGPRLEPRVLRPRGTPAVGFLRRASVLTISWFNAPFKFTYQDWKTATVFTTIPLVLILSGFDDKTFDLLTQHHTPTKDKWAARVDELGRVPVGAAILGGFGAYGYVFDDSRGVHVLESGVIATALAGGLTTFLKYATGRTRPNAGVGSKDFNPFGGEMSFPSGHTTVAFTVAGVINYHYPGWIGRLALLGACGTAWARVYNLHHWPTDVIYAAMISSATAHYVARANLAAAHGDLTLDPVFLDGGGGMAVRKRF